VNAKYKRELDGLQWIWGHTAI